jgi:5-methylcytosine-specific restriction enzyme subunit McrC
MGERLHLEEHEDEEFELDELTEEAAKFVLNNFSSEVDIDFPSLKTGGKWVLRNKGYVGYIDLPGDRSLVLEPKVELDNVFQMMEKAYDLGDFDLSTVYDSDTVEGFYDRIANMLAENVMDRRRRGLYRSYVEKEEKSQRIKGRIDFSETLKKPWKPEAHIKYSEMTADNEDNQLLLYTLNRISSTTGLCRPDTLRKVRKAIRSMRGAISHNEFRASDCAGRTYNRLNSDYERLHALCRLILDNSGPSYSMGDRQMVPFNVEMPKLFQKFVTKWLDENLSERFKIEDEENVTLMEYDKSDDLKYRIDLIIVDRQTGEPVCVIDAKYKDSDRPATEDISQMTGYAKSIDVGETFLMYPADLEEDLDADLNGVRVRNLTFDLEGSLQENGEKFLEDLSDKLGVPSLSA